MINLRTRRRDPIAVDVADDIRTATGRKSSGGGTGLLGRIVLSGTAIAALNSAIALTNRRSMPRLRAAWSVIESVTVCIPARNEADRLPALIADLRAQVGVPRLRVIILDDASTDGTYDAAMAAVDRDERFTVARNDIEPPTGWTGKTAACARLAELAALHAPDFPSAPVAPDSDDRSAPGALIFLDADVRLTPGALAAAVTELRSGGAALVCPWPEQRVGSLAEVLVQPLLAWSWAATLPVALANRTLRPSTAVACGQFLVFDAAAYRSVGGHAAVSAEITEDLAIARALRRAGMRTELTAAGSFASTRMYCGAAELETGYTRWLWSAYGGPVGSAAIAATAALAYWVPPLAAVLGRDQLRRTGLLGYLAAVASRLLARRTETGRRLTATDALAALAHPLSVAAYLRLSARSHRAARTGELTWKNRTLDTNG